MLLPLKTQGLPSAAGNHSDASSPVCSVHLLHSLHRYQLPPLQNRPLLSKAHVQRLEGKESLPTPTPYGNHKVFKCGYCILFTTSYLVFLPALGHLFLQLLLVVAFQLYFQVESCFTLAFKIGL